MENGQRVIFNFGKRAMKNKDPHFLGLNECDSDSRGIHSIVVIFS